MDDGRRQAHGAHVVYIMSRFPLLTETFILREMLELERQGVSLKVFPLLRMRPSVKHAEVERVAAKVHYTPFLSLPIVSANLHFLRRAPRRYLRLLWKVLKGNWGSANLFLGALGVFPKSVYFARLVGRENVRHVHAHFATHPALAALVVSELAGVGYSFTAHAHDIFLHEKMLAEKVERARFVVTISEFNKRYLLERAPRVAPAKVKVIHCGIEPEQYGARRTVQAEDAAQASDAETAERGLTVLSVASLQPYKGIKYLVRACAIVARRIEKFRCLIVGEGADRPELEKLIAELGLEDTVRLLGAKPQHEVAALLDEADLFVLPSVVAPSGQMEGIPVALMEAMASRLAVVSTRLSGIPELIEDGLTGLLVPPADESALADAITALCLDPHLRRQMGERGREKVAAEFELSGNVARLHALFEEATRAGARPESVLSNGRDEREAAVALDREVVEWAEAQFARTAKLGNESNGHTDTRVHFKRLGGGRDSEVFELTAANGGGDEKNLILKLHRPNWARAGETVERGRAHADNEFRALSFLWREFAQEPERLAVPQPLGFKPESAALLIEKCAGLKLERAMRWARLGAGARDELPRWFGACGEWLATFYRVSARDEDPAPVYERIEREFFAELDECRGRGLDAELTSRAARRFQERKPAIFDGSHKTVGRHCDFAPYNVLVSGDKVTVIDFEGLQNGITYDDLCYFLAHVEATPPYHLSRALKASLREEFLSGYARRGQIDRAHFDFFMLATMVKVMAHSPVLGTGGSWRDSLKGRQRLRLYADWFRERLS